MEKIINSQGINTNGRQPIKCLTSLHTLLLVLVFWLPTSSFKYSENNYYLAGYVKHSLSGVENEQSENQKPKLELGFGLDCALQTRTGNLSKRGVA